MRDFLKYVLANFVALAIVGGGCFLLFMLFLSATLISSQPQVTVPGKAVLAINLSAPVVDKPVTEDFSSFLNDMQGQSIHKLSLHQVIEGIDAAAEDKRIAALYLTGNVLDTSWPNLVEIRKALLRFKESGKPIVAYGQYFREVELFIASVADEILIHPMGNMELNGFASQVMFFAGAFEKYGIDVQVTRVGKYKSAVEPYLQDEMSPANREQITLLLNDLFTYFVDTVAESRALEPDQLRTLANEQALLQPSDILAQKLADRTAHYDEVLEVLRGHVSADPAFQFKEQISLRNYIQAQSLVAAGGKGEKVLVLYAEGQIVDGSSRQDLGGQDMAALLRRARYDKTVKAVVLRVNSPGGSATASEVIGREVRLLREEKPVVVSMGNVAASGGYWISAHAHEIFAQPNTITGSIGVFGMFTNFKPMMNNHGLTVDVAKTSEMADALTPFRPKTDQELQTIQAIVDHTYESFLDLVSDGRTMERAKVQEIAQGRVWSGVKAKELGLVDELGGLEDAVAAVAKRAGLEDYQWYQYQRPKKFAEELMEIMEDRERYISANQGPLAQTVKDLQQTWNQLRMFDQPNQVYALMPFNLRWQ